MFKILATILFVTFFEDSNCQTPLVTLPDSLGKNLNYYSPTYPAKAKAPFKGVLNIGQPFDSLGWGEPPAYFATKKPIEPNNLQKGLLVIWDTIQEWECIEFMATKNGKLKPYPVKYVPVYHEDKEIFGQDIKTIGYKGMPVYVLNNTDSNFLVSFPKNGLVIFQEAIDKRGRWRRIEEQFLMPKGYVRPVTSRFIKPGQFIVTTVYKYRGDYSTQLRLCLETRGLKFYSQPFTGSINYSQFVD